MPNSAVTSTNKRTTRGDAENSKLHLQGPPTADLDRRMSIRYRPAFALAVLCWATAVSADAFSAAHYDPKTDELVVTMLYRGTNPEHSFSVQWGQCHNVAPGDKERQIAAQVLDSEWNDAALRDYTKTARFSLKGLRCRPAEVTLHTAPDFYYSVRIP